MTTEYGFYFHPATDKANHGHPKLEFNLYSEPTDAHFDPVRATVPVVGQHGGIESASISNPWSGRKELSACVGRILLADYGQKHVEAFSFGGTLTVASAGNHVACALTSPAPIFDLVEPVDAVTGVISGMEAEIAQQRAKWPHDYQFEARLVAVEPVALYVGSLLSQQKDLESIPERIRPADVRDQLHLVHEMIASARRAGLLNANQRPLSELLAPS